MALMSGAFLVVLGAAAFLHSLEAYQRARLRAWLPTWVHIPATEGPAPKPSGAAENSNTGSCADEC